MHVWLIAYYFAHVIEMIAFVLLLGLTIFWVSIVDLKYQNIFVDEDPLGLLQQPLFLDFSNLIQVVIVKWNHHSFYISLLLVVVILIQILDLLVHFLVQSVVLKF